MKPRRFLDSIIVRLLLLATLIVATGSFTRYYLLSQFLREDLSKVFEEQQLALANYVAHDIDDKIIQRQAMLNQLAARLPVELLEKPDQLQLWLQEHFRYQSMFSVGLFVIGTNGKTIADYPPMTRRRQLSYTDRDFYIMSMRGQPWVGKAVLSRNVKAPVLPMSAPILDEKKRVRAVLVGGTALAAPGFLDLLMQSHIGAHRDSFLLISPRDQQFVAASQADKVLQPTPEPGQNALHDKAMAGFRGAGITVNADGVEEISAIASVPSAGWFVVARIPTREAFATVERTRRFTLRNTILALILFSLIACGGLYLILRPLFRAADHAEKMTRGELPLEPLPIRRFDEVGHMIEAFNRLLRKLNDKQAELAKMAHHDALTGLPNRLLLSDRLRMALAQAQRKQTRVALLFMDLDGFKKINDELGHKAGDKALWMVGQRLSAIVRQTDTLARIGGDEFVLLLSDLDEAAEEITRTVAEKCIEAFETPFVVANTPCRLGISIGIALGGGRSTPDHLLQAADQAMYRVKKTGRSGSETILL
ncbi:GGDEF domain-containing protein [Chromobacterium sp. IIBBL 290-4]|uniref:GGDEF domain-containing protein n=1 Tax=Chromobacterium sp. IIBBL 290-4 TaxID=2953890 RepID=UPI0020B84B8F|nr:GGDEF domain-containing protein [Chromobacterium sp. IIBBL 290-4]UTH73123.1 GGDEF domain-containing protein [Chromobacterium sp. IIBBL 290-4]